MNETVILLVDFNPSNTLVNDLRIILASVPAWVIQYQRLSPADDAPTKLASRLAEVTANQHLDVGLLVLDPFLLNQGRDVLRCLQEALAPLPLVLALDGGEPEMMSFILKMGIADFITTPLTPLNVLPRIRRLAEHFRERLMTVSSIRGQLGLNQLIGESRPFRAVKEKIPLIARSNGNVLISGETGTGKELCARAIHYLSPRAERGFVPVNCGAFPPELIESELFGHERGAFTTAISAQPGLIQEADGGTLFLDEIDCLGLMTQVKLLRFLQEREYRRLGSPKTRRSDARVVAAANIDFEQAVRIGSLRQDLYYRLNVIPLRLPPLRERREDIPILAIHFLKKYAREFHRPDLTFADDALALLERYDWPGNVRELEHLMERVVVLAEHEVIQSCDLGIFPSSVVDQSPVSFREAKIRFERAYVEDLLSANKGNITRAAKAARKNRRAFWELIRKHNIDANYYRTHG
jgi:two-component system, NtrC family, response regulator GlrR